MDDIRHMNEMEEEQKARAAEEEERQARMKKIKDQFEDPNAQWEKDKTDIQNDAMQEKKAEEEEKTRKLTNSGPISPRGESEVGTGPTPAQIPPQVRVKVPVGQKYERHLP